jgi:hypothetical protein
MSDFVTDADDRTENDQSKLWYKRMCYDKVLQDDGRC